MAVPTYDKFIEPVLRFLATRPEGALVREVREAAAEMLGLDEQQRAEVITSGQLTYQNRTGWAHDRLKRAGLSQSLSRGKWCLTPAGMSWVASHPQPMTELEVSHFACDFNGVKLSKLADAVALDPQPESIEDDELARSSPDDRLEQALNEIRESVAEELLENLLQVSPARFEDAVLVFDDPRHLSRQERYENGEYRWQTLGLVHGIVVILVAHSVRFESGFEVIRIISARKADRKERNRYEHG
ncbi:TPA: BrnT family toxin [Salmonella enterica subsp. enterica serovar Typhimurium]|uniref:Restriction system protein Mrr-like N-terminal domain-containing protein n=6 Tax=Salmonella TaxID=590 RepID=A0A708L370_SALTM|nr:hypothetical protein [Salmonella enterica subsp. enterica serovar Typhimurium]HAE7186169.1 hypothetical protein [Salmonella enterica subsp. enterica serovar Typhimurium]HBZ6560917.1 BrnT family toxin [Salmonella enterica subsp. enterica serovar Typhimurium]HBZ6774282.1 BrnT family toxin [Salmonella enterica subsp. enterica serovar Typhimurium]HCK5174116.1 BrnT family toxin [Salmonella enterica subsp. enterica serovar Typhimurium]